jgi:hypothetical protein
MRVELSGVSYEPAFAIRNRGEKEIVSVADFSPESSFVGGIMEKLLDAYLEFHERYSQGEYSYNDTLYGEFPDKVFLSVEAKFVGLLKMLPESFAEEFVRHTLENFDNGDYADSDGPLMLKYGFCLSEESKKEIIRNCQKYYEAYRESLP